MDVEQYDDCGDIKSRQERTLSHDQKHRIHQTKDMFDSDCSLCQEDMRKRVKTYWKDDE